MDESSGDNSWFSIDRKTKQMSFDISKLQAPFAGKFALSASLSNNFDEHVVKSIYFWVKIYEFSCFKNKPLSYEVGQDPLIFTQLYHEKPDNFLA